MRLGKVAFVVALGICSMSRAEDSVVVDLSVLDNLNTTYIAPAEPLFPVLPKQNKLKTNNIKKAKKTNNSKQVKKTSVKEKIAVRTEPLVEVADKKSEILVTDKESFVEVVDKEPVVVDVEPVVVVDVEPVSPVAPLMSENSTETIAKKTTNNQQSEIISESKDNVAVQQDKNAQAEIINETPEVPSLIEPVQSTVTDKRDNVSELLIEENVPEEKTSDNRIIFADDVDELNPEQMSKIDAIISGFKNTDTNKIAIYSYNLDDGVDSFKKKRISLNRAVEVRSYLIKQGYKNFSIKVININTGSDNINTVELEEI